MKPPPNPHAIALPESFLKRQAEVKELVSRPHSKNDSPMPRVGSTFTAYGMEWQVVKTWRGGRMQVKQV